MTWTCLLTTNWAEICEEMNVSALKNVFISLVSHPQTLDILIDIHKHQMRIWAMQSSYRCLQSFLAALNGAQSSVCCHCSGTRLSHPSIQQWQLTTHGLPDVVYTCYMLPWWSSFMVSWAAVGKSCLASALKDPYGTCCLSQPVKWVQSELEPQQDDAGFIDCDTSIPLCLLGETLISIQTMFCVSLMGTPLEGKGIPVQITESKWAIL